MYDSKNKFSEGGVMKRKLSKVEVKGLEAIFYDELMQILSGFTYNRFINKVISDMKIKPKDNIIDFGSGTAKNICLMTKYTDGIIIGLDKGKEMLSISKKRCKNHVNVKIFNHDIRVELPFVEFFDKVFISFVLHGFIDKERDLIIKNAYKVLRKGGQFCILDYNEFDLTRQNPLVKFVFKYGECPLASEFIKIDLKKKLTGFGFKEFTEHYYYSDLVRLLIATK